jgi:hypothetical protein
MFWWIVGLSFVFLPALAVPAGAAGLFANPVKDCHPCRFSPGPGQPAFDLTFVFEGAGDLRALTALDIAPAGGGQTQRLEVGPLDVADFPDGFILGDADMNFDSLGDLSVITQVAADNSTADYWVYQPKARSFVPLERVNDDKSGTALSAGPDGRLVCHVRGSLVEYTDYFYQVTGHRAVAVTKDSREIDDDLIVDTTYDLTVRPNHLVKRTIVGFSGDSPARQAFLGQLDAASIRAEALYRRGDPACAAASIAAVVQDRQLSMLTGSYPVTNDSGDLRLVRQFNDYGFYLERAGQPKQAVAVLAQVTDVDADRSIAYLNLGDAQYAAGQPEEARGSYIEFRKRMAAAGKLAEVPDRVANRLRRP